MKRVLSLLRWSLITVAALAGVLAGLFGYFIYSPAPELPRLSGTLAQRAIVVGGMRRTYLIYVPRGLRKGAPLVIVMHGSGEDGARIRVQTGYGFERLADQRGFAVVYPNAYSGYWDVCSIVGALDVTAVKLDDVRFLTGLTDQLIKEIGIDPGRVFATGVSRGGAMALRLALEAPVRFRAVAAVAASVPAPDNFKCRIAEHFTSSVMIMNGTEDPLVPFDGGEVSLFGLLYKNGKVRSSRDSGQYLAHLNDVTSQPVTRLTPAADGMQVEQVVWRNGSKVEIELVAIHGGGHGMPQPYFRQPRLLGRTAREPNGPAMIWAFFARQQRR